MDALEVSVSAWPVKEGRFLQVSGITFAFDAEQEPGHRIVTGSVTVGGAPLEPSKAYTVATKAYLRSGKDGFGTLKDAEEVIDPETVPRLASANRSVSPARGRWLGWAWHTNQTKDSVSFVHPTLRHTSTRVWPNMLLVDKYRPKTLDEFNTINASTATTLKAVVSQGDCPHTLFYGPPGAGKKTLVLAMLRELYGPAAAKVHVEYKPWKITLPSGSTKEIEFATVSSAYHIEINPSDVGTNDRYVVQEIIKEMARSRPIGTSGEKTYKILILNEVDKLSKEAQAGLRRTMEKYANACRLVLCCNNVSKVIEPLRSRCLLVRVGAPQAAQCVDLLTRVAAQEGMGVPAGLIDNIVTTSRRNMRRALLSMEALVVRAGGEGLSENTPVVLPDWEMYIKEIAGDVMREQTAKNLFVVRGKLYELIVNCIPPEVILRTLVRELCRTLDDELKRQAVELAATYEWRLQQGQKAIFHLEAFIAKFMSVFKSYMVSLMG